jgi:hypothetical protein
MKIEASESFFESVEKLVWYDSKLWKVWEFITITIPLFFKNIWRFRKELARHNWWDYTYTLEILYRSLSIMVVKLEKDGIEEDVCRMKKVNAIKRVLELLRHKLDDDYVDRAELKLGKVNWKPIEFKPTKNGLYEMIDNETPAERKHLRKVFQYASKLENEEWAEIWETIGGNQSISEYKKLLKGKTPAELLKHNLWNEWYNGSDMRGWWD